MAKSETNNNGVSHIHNLVETVIEQAGCLLQAVNQYPPLSVERDKEIQRVAPRYQELPDMWGYAIKQASEIDLLSVLGPLEDLQKAHNRLIDVSVDCRRDSSKWGIAYANHCEAVNRLTDYLPAVESASETDLEETGKRKRPTAAKMENRNRAVAMAAAEIKRDYGRLPSVQEIVEKTKFTAEQVYSTVPYQEGKIARRSAKLTTEGISGSVTTSEQFKEKSIEHSRARRLSKSEQLERDALIDKHKEDNAGDEKMHKRYLRNKGRTDAEDH